MPPSTDPPRDHAMKTVHHALTQNTPGVAIELQSLHFGKPGKGPKATLQAALHAEESRFYLVGGKTSTRHYADLFDAVVKRVDGQLTFDASHNVALIRDALREA